VNAVRGCSADDDVVGVAGVGDDQDRLDRGEGQRGADRVRQAAGEVEILRGRCEECALVAEYVVSLVGAGAIAIAISTSSANVCTASPRSFAPARVPVMDALSVALSDIRWSP
jgi:hypothetical protein